MVIYSKSFPIKDHKALQLIKVIKWIKLVKNSFIKTFTFLLSRDSCDFELQSTQVAMRGLKRGMGTLTMWKIKPPPTSPSIHLNKASLQPINFITLLSIFYFLERELSLTQSGRLSWHVGSKVGTSPPTLRNISKPKCCERSWQSSTPHPTHGTPMARVQVKWWPHRSGLKTPIEETVCKSTQHKCFHSCLEDKSNSAGDFFLLYKSAQLQSLQR